MKCAHNFVYVYRFCCRRLVKASAHTHTSTNKRERIWQKIDRNKQRTRGKENFFNLIRTFLRVFIRMGLFVCVYHDFFVHYTPQCTYRNRKNASIVLPFQSAVYWFWCATFMDFNRNPVNNRLKRIRIVHWKLLFPSLSFFSFPFLCYFAIKKFLTTSGKWNSIQQMNKLIIFLLWMRIMMCQLTD